MYLIIKASYQAGLDSFNIAWHDKIANHSMIKTLGSPQAIIQYLINKLHWHFALNGFCGATLKPYGFCDATQKSTFFVKTL